MELTSDESHNVDTWLRDHNTPENVFEYETMRYALGETSDTEYIIKKREVKDAWGVV